MNNLNNTQKNKLLSKIENRLLSTKKYKQTWWIIFGLTILFFGICAITLGFQFSPNHSEQTKVSLTLNHSFALASQILTYISFGIIAIPYLYLSGAWISGVNNTSRSKYFHLFIWIIYFIVFVLALIALILNFRAFMIG